MAICEFCKKEFTPTIHPINHRKSRYCSKMCIKSAWYIKRTNAKTTIYKSHSKDDFMKSTSGKGFFWQEFLAKQLGAKNINSCQCDVIYNGLKIDVKSANLYYRKFAKGKKIKKISNQKGWWVFNRNNPKSIDFFFLVCLIDNEPYKFYLIPEKEFPQKGAVIGWKSKYDKFRIWQ